MYQLVYKSIGLEWYFPKSAEKCPLCVHFLNVERLRPSAALSWASVDSVFIVWSTHAQCLPYVLVVHSRTMGITSLNQTGKYISMLVISRSAGNSNQQM